MDKNIFEAEKWWQRLKNIQQTAPLHNETGPLICCCRSLFQRKSLAEFPHNNTRCSWNVQTMLGAELRNFEATVAHIHHRLLHSLYFIAEDNGVAGRRQRCFCLITVACNQKVTAYIAPWFALNLAAFQQETTHAFILVTCRTCNFNISFQWAESLPVTACGDNCHAIPDTML